MYAVLIRLDPELRVILYHHRAIEYLLMTFHTGNAPVRERAGLHRNQRPESRTLAGSPQDLWVGVQNGPTVSDLRLGAYDLAVHSATVAALLNGCRPEPCSLRWMVCVLPSRSKVVLQFVKTPPSFRYPVSQACTQAQFENSAYDYWCSKIKETPRLHRKQWEFCYILQCLATQGALAPGRRGLGYGVGTEPLSAVFATYGCRLTATDLETERAASVGWTSTNEHASHKAAMNDRAICDPTAFDSQVDFRFVDMNHIPEDLKGFDFTWSACALEHLGSISNGLEFIKNTIATLRPGGIAVHTTELNCSSDDDTVDNEGTVLFRKRDILKVCHHLSEAGCSITLNFDTGHLPVDNYVDVPPYNPDKHLKLKLGEYTTTSFGLLVRAPD